MKNLRDHGLFCWLLGAVLGLAPMQAMASDSFEALLSKADAIRSSEPVEFQKLLQELDSRKSLATPEQSDHLQYLHAYGKSFTGHYETAIGLADSLIESSPSTALQVRAGALMINSYAILQQYRDGLQQIDKTMPLIDKIKDHEVRNHALFSIATLYGEVGQFALALQYLEQINLEHASGRTQCFVNDAKIRVQQRTGTLPADDAVIARIIRQCLEQGEQTPANNIRSVLARHWAAQGQRKKAITLLQTHLAEVEATRYPRLIAEVHSLLGELLFFQGDIEGAEHHSQVAITRGSSIVNAKPLVRAYQTLYRIAQKRGDSALALDYYQRYAEADKAHLNETMAREIAYQGVRQEAEFKAQQSAQKIQLLSQQNKVLQLQQKVSAQSAQNFRLLIVLLLVLLAVAGYWVYHVMRRQRLLRRSAQTDALTGVCNRQHFVHECKQALAQCAAAGEQVAVVMFDLDNFKQINDRFGHAVGDWALQQVADSGMACRRRSDYFCRWGGEEFAIFLPGCSLEIAVRRAEACRVRIADVDSSESGHDFTVSASFGVTTSKLSGYNLDRLLSNADQAMYDAKRAGRNRVCAYSPETAEVADMADAARAESGKESGVQTASSY